MSMAALGDMEVADELHPCLWLLCLTWGGAAAPSPGDSNITDRCLCCPLPPSSLGHSGVTEPPMLPRRCALRQDTQPLMDEDQQASWRPYSLRLICSPHPTLPSVDSLEPSPQRGKPVKTPTPSFFASVYPHGSPPHVLVSVRARAFGISLTP